MPADDVPTVPDIVPALLICQAVPDAPETASPLTLVIMLPVLVTVSGLLDDERRKLPLTAVLIVWPAIAPSETAVWDDPSKG